MNATAAGGRFEQEGVLRQAFLRPCGEPICSGPHLVPADDYRGLTEALTRTDELIDQIVYALYGLPEEEIAIVEESVEG